MQDSFISEEDNIIKDDKIPTTPSEVERVKFTQRNPLITLLIFCVGSVTNIIQVTTEALDQFQISIRYKNEPNVDAMHLYGFCNTCVQVFVYFGTAFANISMSSIPKLIGARKRDEATQLAVDIYRCIIIFTIVFPPSFFFLIPYIVRFMGCPEESVHDALMFCLPPAVGMIVIVTYNNTIGFFMAIGKSETAATLRCIACIVQTGMITPLFLFVIKVPLGMIRSPMVFSQIIVCSYFLFSIFKGKYTIKPTLKMFCKPFTKHILPALPYGIPTMFRFLCIALPPMIILRILTSALPEKSVPIGAVFGVLNRMSTYSGAIPALFTYALLCVGTHAYGSKDFRRLFQYTGWAIVLGTGLILIFVLALTLAPRTIGGIFLYDDYELELCEKILRIPFYTTWLQPFCLVCNAFLIILGKSFVAFIMAGIQAVLLCAGGKILTLIIPNDPFISLYVYNCSDVIMFLVYVIVMIIPVKKVYHEMKENEANFMSSLFSTLGEYQTIIDDSSNN